MPEINIYPDEKSLIEAGAALFIRQAQCSIAARGRFMVALSGGSTPKPIYAALAEQANREQLDWANVHLFWGDERHVPPESPESNYGMVKSVLLDKVPIPAENVHRVPAEMDARLAAFSYEETLRHWFEGEWPRFDLVLLGMGEDGHTASLFPHSAGLNEEDRWFIANEVPAQQGWRLTLTKHALNAARMVAVLVRGESKAAMLRAVLTGPWDPENMPIQLIAPQEGELIWLLDREAAHLLPDQLRP